MSESRYRWNWPEVIDAMRDAPEHHKILLENDQVRVLKASVAPATPHRRIRTGGRVRSTC